MSTTNERRGAVALYREYDVAFEGKSIVVEAAVNLASGRVQIGFIREHNGRDEKTYPGEPITDEETGKTYTVALGSWTRERRLALYEAVREAARTGKVL